MRVYIGGMNDEKGKIKIDINGSISDSFWEVVSTIGGVGMLFIFCLCLIAPILSSSFRHNLERPNGGFLPLMYDYSIIDRKMRRINLILWLICITSWIFFMWCNVRQDKWN